jgi:hypothetical protein
MTRKITGVVENSRNDSQAESNALLLSRSSTAGESQPPATSCATSDAAFTVGRCRSAGHWNRLAVAQKQSSSPRQTTPELSSSCQQDAALHGACAAAHTLTADRRRSRKAAVSRLDAQTVTQHSQAAQHQQRHHAAQGRHKRCELQGVKTRRSFSSTCAPVEQFVH